MDKCFVNIPVLGLSLFKSISKGPAAAPVLQSNSKCGHSSSKYFSLSFNEKLWLKYLYANARCLKRDKCNTTE